MLPIIFMMMVTFWAFIGLVFLVFVFGVVCLIHALDPKTKQRWKHIVGAVILLPPSIYFFYLLNR
jgi:hypothetical protein